MFRDPNSSEVFRTLSREFERFGFQFDRNFVNHVFFGERVSPAADPYLAGRPSVFTHQHMAFLGKP
ncbi:MAG: hypothetical protein KAJ09_12445 [Deltaproteobacteria bacterium]|nr:hypothetical protein [Deltaproteobacteria bacterium]